MNNLLRRLYHGEIFPDEQIVPRDALYRPLTRKIGAERSYFEGILSPQDRLRFEELGLLHAQETGMHQEAAFYYGFKLGAALMLAAHTKPDASEN